jgi:TonB family protein
VASGTSLTADAAPPRVSTLPHAVEPSKRSPTEIEKQVFGDRKIYSMTLNMPNLNSAGGSWVIHFAELKNNSETGDLSTPVPTHEVDPGYPMELMRQNVQGTVTLHAVIRSDGSVGTVQVLRGIDDRLDEYARSALSRWRFQPATKNGKVVDLEAVVIIPFRPGPRRNGF